MEHPKCQVCGDEMTIARGDNTDCARCGADDHGVRCPHCGDHRFVYIPSMKDRWCEGCGRLAETGTTDLSFNEAMKASFESFAGTPVRLNLPTNETFRSLFCPGCGGDLGKVPRHLIDLAVEVVGDCPQCGKTFKLHKGGLN